MLNQFCFQEEKSYITSNLKTDQKVEKLPFPPLKQIFTTPAFLALMVVHFCHNWGLYTMVTEIPTYLNNIQHFPLKAVSIFA